MYDVIVVGAGPAGSTFARLAPRCLKLLVLERSLSFGKCCGGLIAPDAQASLAAFDIGIPKSVLADPQLLYVRAMDLETGREARYQRHYANVDRAAFDEYLASLIPPEVELRRGAAYAGHRVLDGRVVVSVRAGGRVEELECRALVAADGGNSGVRRRLYPREPSPRRYFAIQGEYERLEPINHYSVFFDREITDYYSWLIPKGDTVLVGGAFPEGSKYRERFDRLVAAVGADAYRLGPRRAIGGAWVVRPRIGDARPGSKRVALAGEAGGFVSPSSSEGLSYAYRSAAALARAMDPLDGGWAARYAALTANLRLELIAKLAKSRVLYDTRLRDAIFRTKIGSLRRM